MRIRKWATYLQNPSWLRLLAWSAFMMAMIGMGVTAGALYIDGKSQDIRMVDPARVNPYFELLKEEAQKHDSQRGVEARNGYSTSEESPRASSPSKRVYTAADFEALAKGPPPWERIAPAVFAIWVLLMCTLAVFRLWCHEPNLGWRRLAVIASAGGAGAAVLFAVDANLRDVAVISMVFAAAAAAFAAVLIGRRLYLSVWEGFNVSGDASPTDPPSSQTIGTTAPIGTTDPRRSRISMATRLRLFGAAILFINLMLIGRYEITGLLTLLMTFGFAIAYEYLIVRPVEARHRGQ
jgi:hypothetical protein